jgi:glycine dehydrogenase
VTAEHWEHGYTREVAAFPTPALRQRKYWPPVARVDNVYGDRHLVCSCGPTSDWAEAAAPQ